MLGPVGLASAGTVGLALAYTNNIIINLNGMIFDWVQTEVRMVGVERMLEYAALPAEPQLGPGRRPASMSSDWPRLGAVSFDSVSLRYGDSRARSHCRFIPPLIQFIPESLAYSIHLFLKRQCD